MDDIEARIADVEYRLNRHEAVCEERWKTVFNKLEDFDERSTQRYEEHKREFGTFRAFAFSGMGAIILCLIGLLASGAQ